MIKMKDNEKTFHALKSNYRNHYTDVYDNKLIYYMGEPFKLGQ